MDRHSRSIKCSKGKRKGFLHLEKELEKRVVGQDLAVKAVSEAIRRSRSGLSDPRDPWEPFFSSAPQAWVKQNWPRRLLNSSSIKKRRLIRLDMSEYMEKHTVSKLIGSPPGYVGYEEGGQLTEALQKTPLFCRPL